jgi:drug/metabolite transporter (DMT)-like permease
MSSHLRGLVYGLTASALWGTAFVAARYLVEVRQLDPFYMAAVRFGMGGLIALAYAWAKVGTRKVLAAGELTVPIMALGAAGPVGLGALVFVSAQYTTSINSSLIVNSNAIFIAMFAVFLGERVGWLRFGGLWVGLLGCGIVIFSAAPEQPLSPSNNLLGGAAALGAAICWAAYTAFGKAVVRKLGGPLASAWCILCGGLMLAVVALFEGGIRPLTGHEMLAVGYMAVGPTAIAMGLWYRALELVDSSALGPSQYIAPVVSVILGWLLLHEPVAPSFVVGCLVTLVGVYMATKPLKSDSR